MEIYGNLEEKSSPPASLTKAAPPKLEQTLGRLLNNRTTAVEKSNIKISEIINLQKYGFLWKQSSIIMKKVKCHHAESKYGPSNKIKAKAPIATLESSLRAPISISSPPASVLTNSRPAPVPVSSPPEKSLSATSSSITL